MPSWTIAPMKLLLVFLLFVSSPSLLLAENKGKELYSEDLLRLQIFLDRNNFAPGALDGKAGEFTTKAADMFRRSHALTNPKNDFSDIQFRVIEPVTVRYT